MDTHVKVAAWLRIIWSAVHLVVALVVMLVFSGVSVLLSASGDADAHQAIPWVAVVGTCLSLFFALLALPGLVTGWGLLTYRPWARAVDIALSAFDLFHVPVGTALGAYSIWVMIQPETIELFEVGRPSGRYPAHF
jgi:hypothetical protein